MRSNLSVTCSLIQVLKQRSGRHSVYLHILLPVRSQVRMYAVRLGGVLL